MIRSSTQGAHSVGLAGCLALLVLGSVVSCNRPAAENEPPRRVFLITVDTLRADHMSAYGYPRRTSPDLDELAGRGVTFNRAIAQWPKTGPSFASIFTGRYPRTTGLTHRAAQKIPEQYVTLPEVFRAAGYTTLGVVSNAVLSAELGWNRGFDEYLETWKLGGAISDDPLEHRKWVSASLVNQLAIPALDNHAAAERLFVWLHYSDPHAPYLLPAGEIDPFLGDSFDTQNELVDAELPPARSIGDDRRLGAYIAKYDANILVTDTYIGAVLDHLDRLGLLEDALVIFTSDHGEGLGEHEELFEHGREPYNTTAHVPLFISYTGVTRAGHRIDHPVELVDLYPTLLDLLQIEQETEGLEGSSLVALLDHDGALDAETLKPFRYAFSEAGGGQMLWRHYQSVQDGRWKLVFHPAVDRNDRQLPPTFELFHLESDPLEAHNLAGDAAGEFDRLWMELSNWLEKTPESGQIDSDSEAYSEETLNALRALGYVN
jgi:arylsulfatase A-like enzyme